MITTACNHSVRGHSFAQSNTVPDDLQDVSPLLLRRVNAGGIVSTHVQEHDAALRTIVEIRQHTFEVESETSGVEVGIGLCLNSSILENTKMCLPRH
jgi:hypothetical protein